MILNALLSKILIGVVYLAIILLFAWLWKKMKKKPVAGGTIGFFVGTVPAVMMAVLPSGLYVVTGEESYSEYWVYGSATYTTQEGDEIEITSTNLEYTVINDTDIDFVIEEVIYGFHIPEDEFLYAGDDVIIDKKISYFFGDIPPDEIEVEAGKYASRYWLRTVEDYDEDYN